MLSSATSNPVNFQNGHDLPVGSPRHRCNRGDHWTLIPKHKVNVTGSVRRIAVFLLRLFHQDLGKIDLCSNGNPVGAAENWLAPLAPRKILLNGRTEARCGMKGAGVVETGRSRKPLSLHGFPGFESSWFSPPFIYTRRIPQRPIAGRQLCGNEQ